ncbi:MAG: UDP-N-acetylmuramate dehydrogenase [Flavobacteriales bacterium]|nr:UDP-N-acetylmuramate dehydrogenase [Flavobacteriales bacterium]
MTIEENITLRSYHTFHCESSARYLARCATTDDLQLVLADQKFREMPMLILGGGSNVLFTSDFNGLVLRNELKGIRVIQEDDTHVWLQANGGEVWNDVVNHAIANGWGGLENLSLIPGNIGAAPMQNIGAYGVELKDVFHSLEAINREDGSVQTFSHADCAFGYRESVFKNTLKDCFIITSVTLRLTKHPVVNTSYGAIEKELEVMGINSPGIREVGEAVCRIRQSKLPDPEHLGNAGSFFKNPVIDKNEAIKLAAEFPEMPAYPQEDGTVKLAAGWLIEQCGLKGIRNGDAGVHEKQALVLVNYGHAKGKEIYQLSEHIQQVVSSRFGIMLNREVNIIG